MMDERIDAFLKDVQELEGVSLTTLAAQFTTGPRRCLPTIWIQLGIANQNFVDCQIAANAIA